MKRIIYLILTIAFLACTSSTENEIENIYWVNSTKVACVGVGPMSCLQTQKSDTLNLNADWNLFYSQIEGFIYEPGFIYKLKIKETQIENPPADASSIKYTLVDTLEKLKDKRLEIHDIWVLESLNGITINSDSISKQPQIEINVTQMKIYGNNGCNQISGSIKTLNETNLEFGSLIETLMMCPNMKIPTLFSHALLNVKKYKKEGLRLFLRNDLDTEILIFKKID